MIQWFDINTKKLHQEEEFSFTMLICDSS